ncbi:MAG: FliM/FliN family flagellar motor switch protein [Pseudomonadota bacterium]
MSELELLDSLPAGGLNPAPLPSAAPAASGVALPPVPGAPHISAARAAFSVQLGRGCSAALWLHGEVPATISLYALDQKMTGALDARSSLWREPVLLDGPFGAVQLADGARLLRAITGIDLGHAGGDGGSDWLYGAVLARLGASPLACVDGVRRSALGAIDDECVLRIVLRSDDHSVVCHGRASAAVWSELLLRGDWQRERVALHHFAALPLTLPLVIARHTLTAERLQALLPGDLIVPDNASFGCDGAGLVRLGGSLLRVAYAAPNCLTIIDLESAVDQPDNLQDADLAQPDSSDYARHGDDMIDGELLAGLPLTLRFVLGQVRLPLGRLQELGAGAVLDIEDGSPAALAIECNGRRLGTAEIVDIDGRFGVRVLQWGAAS